MSKSRFQDTASSRLDSYSISPAEISISAGFVLIFIILASCSNPFQSKTEAIYPKITYQLNIPEPSGICFGKNYETLWIVSDNHHNKVYNTDLQGNILQTLIPGGDDFEGITYDHRKDVLWIAEEQLQEIIQVSTTGLILEHLHVKIHKSGQNGLEGVTMAQPSGFWVVNEKKPVSLARLDSTGNIINIYDEAFAKDYSDVYFDVQNNVLWIISDESKLIMVWSREHGLIESYKLPFDKAEGIAIQPITRQIFIVNDALSTLTLFDLIEKQ